MRKSVIQRLKIYRKIQRIRQWTSHYRLDAYHFRILEFQKIPRIIEKRLAQRKIQSAIRIEIKDQSEVSIWSQDQGIIVIVIYLVSRLTWKILRTGKASVILLYSGLIDDSNLTSNV